MLSYERNKKDSVMVLKVKGNLDAMTAPEIRQEIEKIVDENCLKVVVDLSDLQLIDSSGVGAIVSLFKRIRTKGGNVKIAGIQGQPKEIFRLLGLEKAFGISKTVEEAIEKF